MYFTEQVNAFRNYLNDNKGASFLTLIGESRESNCSMIEKIPPKGVSFSDLICILPCHIRVLLVFFP